MVDSGPRLQSWRICAVASAARAPASVAAPHAPDDTSNLARSRVAWIAAESLTATAASHPSRSTGQARLETVPQFSPSITVWPVLTETGAPCVKLASAQAAVSGSTDRTVGWG